VFRSLAAGVCPRLPDADPELPTVWGVAGV
jgi:hypothetical protein